MTKSAFLTSFRRVELEAIVGSPRKDHGVALRAYAILLLDDGWSCDEVGKALYLDDDTIHRWYKEYQRGGVDLLAAFEPDRAIMEGQASICDP